MKLNFCTVKDTSIVVLKILTLFKNKPYILVICSSRSSSSSFRLVNVTTGGKLYFLVGVEWGLNPTNNQPTNQAKPNQTTDWSTNRPTDKPIDWHPWSRVLPEKLTDPQLVKKFPTFMEPEGSLPLSLEPATCPYTEPDQSIPCLPSHFLKNQFNIILPSMPMSSISSFLPTKTLYAPLLSPVCVTCPSHSCWLNIWYWLWSSLLCSLLHSPVTSFFLGHSISPH